MKAHHLAWAGCKGLARAVGTLALWTLWLGLAFLLALQVYVASTDRLEVPQFALRALERRLALSGTHATFGRTIFDPSGRILAENVALTLPGFEEPVVSARAVYARLDPWALAVGRFEPTDLRVTGVTLRVPAMLSPSGRADEIVRDLDGEFQPRGAELAVDLLNFKLGEFRVSAQGALHLPPARRRGAEAPLPFAEFLARNYAALSREFADAIETLSVLDQPVLTVELAPSESSGAIVNVTLVAQGLRLASPFELRAAPLVATGQFPFVTAPGAPMTTELDFAAGEIDLPRGIVAHDAQARIHVRLPSGRLRFDRDAFRDVELTASSITGEGVTVQAPLVSLAAGPLPGIRAVIRALLFEEPLSVHSEIDLKAATARVRFDGAFAPALLGPVGARAGRDLRKYAVLTSPVALAGEARFGPGWKFQKAVARVAVRGATVWHVRLDEASGRIEFDGRRLVAPEMYVRFGDSEARGSYEQEIASRDYRFLIEGRLRPPVIGPWFSPQSWWHEFFRPFGFPGDPPAAKADVQGSWANSRKSVVFVAVDSVRPVYRGVPFDRVRTRLFITPGSDDGWDVLATSGARSARGSFSYRRDEATGAWQSVAADVTSTFDLGSVAKIIGPKGAAFLQPFSFDRAPSVRATGRFEGPAAPGGPHEQVQAEVRTDGPFRFHDFPFSRMAFTVNVADDAISVGSVDAGFAGGAVAGRGQLRGRGSDRRLDFDASLKGASLGQAIALAEGFAAAQSHRPPPAVTKFVQEKSGVKLDLTASGHGRSDDFLGFQGGGKIAVEGAELGQLRLLGLFSQLLPVFSMRFTAGRADFKIAGPLLVFSDVEVTGANSVIKASGTYGLEKHALDFNARFFPFQKSKSLPQQLINGVLAPLSEVLEVKLTGSLDDPQWVFVNGPTNFLRKMAAPAAPPAQPPAASH